MRVLIALAAVVLMTASASGQTARTQSFEGNLASAGARVTFPLQLEAGQVVTLTTSSAGNVDTVLTLNGPNGRRVAENDDQAPGVLSSRVVYVATASGQHSAVVTGFNGATGAFALAVSRGLDVGLSDAARIVREDRLTFDRRRREHRVEVDLAADDILVASTFAFSEGLDTTLTLLNAEGAVLTQNDDVDDGNVNSQLVYQVAASGRYVVVAATYGGEGSGDFALSLAVDPNAEAPFNFASIDGAVITQDEGALSDGQPSREYRLTLAAGQTILALSEATSGSLDTVLRLLDASGDPVAVNDDRGDGSLNSALAYTAPAAGSYTLELARFRGSNTSGGFRLSVSTVDASVVDTLQALIENQVRLSGTEQIIETTDFRVHYTVEGRDAAEPDYARAVADTLQSALDAQRQIGFSAPLRDRHGRYRVYVADARGLMGFARQVQVMFDNPSTPDVREQGATRGVLVIDNDFAGMPKKAPPESLMRATATHELNHLVQYGYDASEGLRWLYESTASWIETATAGRDQDATDYVETDFAAPELCWTTDVYGHDYAQWTLLQSLADSHGQGIVVRLWENTVRYDGFETMSQTLSTVGTTIPDALQRWRVQNFARDYDLAPRFSRAVRRGGIISRNGSWSPNGRIQQLGAHYVEVRLQGPRSYALRGDANLELIALGRRNGEIEAAPLGREGVFDASGYEYAALMVFNRALPPEPGRCSEARYSINVSAGAGAAPAAAYRFSAEHFRPPT